MGLARGRGRGKGGIPKPKNRGPIGKPPPLMGRLAPPPGMGLRPRGPPIPPLVPRMRPPPPPPGMRSPRILPPPIPPVLGPPRPPMPPFHPPPPPHGHLPPPPPLAIRPPVPPPSLLRARGPPPLMRGPGFRPPPGPPMMPKFGPGKRNPVQKGPKKKQKGKKMEMGDESEINKPWVTEAMKNEIQKKHKLYQKAKKSNQQADWDEFKEQRNRVTTMIREAKLEYIGSHPEEVGDKFCEVCDRQFDSSLKYTEHIAEHATCGLEGCTFTAHPKIVAKHVEAQHLSGLFCRIGKTDSPEDIAKWISDRKRHYPTKENMERKRAEMLEKTQRGERLIKDNSRFNRDVHNRRRGGDYNRRGRGRGRSHFSREKGGFGFVKEESDDLGQEEQNCCRGNLCLFPGIRFFEQEEVRNPNEFMETENYSDTEWETSEKMRNLKSVVPVASRALNNLMCQYGSDASETDNEAPMEIPILKTEVARCPSPLEPVTINSNEKNIQNLNLESVHMYSSKHDCENIDERISSALSVESKSCASSVNMDLQDCRRNSTCVEDNCSLPLESQEIIKPEKITSEIITPVCKEEMFVSSESVISKVAVDTGNKSLDSRGEIKCSTIPCHKSNVQSKRNVSNSFQNRIPNVCQAQNTRRHRKTLLEKLLEKEILHERNVILQCVRYVVDKEFFGVRRAVSSKNSVDSGKPLLENKGAKGSCNIGILLKCIKFIVRGNFLDISKLQK